MGRRYAHAISEIIIEAEVRKKKLVRTQVFPDSWGHRRLWLRIPPKKHGSVPISKKCKNVRSALLLLTGSYPTFLCNKWGFCSSIKEVGVITVFSTPTKINEAKCTTCHCSLDLPHQSTVRVLFASIFDRICQFLPSTNCLPYYGITPR